MDEEVNNLKNDSAGTNYTFRDKHGNLVSSSDGCQATDDSMKKQNDVAQFNNHSIEGHASSFTLKPGTNSNILEEEKENRLDDPEDEQPSMLTNSELKSIDLNILGECYIPSSDIFSENKETEQDESEFKNQQIHNQAELESRNLNIANKHNREGKRIDSMDSQKIDSLLKKSVDDFISTTNDVYESLEKLNNLKKKENLVRNKIEPKHEKVHIPHNNTPAGFQRSASQKYNYRKGIGDPDPRYIHVSPMGSGKKDRANYNARPLPIPNQNFNMLPRYSSLMPRYAAQEQEVYYVQPLKDHTRQNTHYSFSGPRNSEQMHTTFPNQISNSLNYTVGQSSVDDNMHDFMINKTHDEFHPIAASPEFQYYTEGGDEYRPVSQRHMKRPHKTSSMVNNSKIIGSNEKIRYPNYKNEGDLQQQNLPHIKIPKQNTYEIIEEEKNFKPDISNSAGKINKNVQGHNRNATYVTSSNDEEINENNETNFETGHVQKYKQVIKNSDKKKPRTNQPSINPPFDSFSNQLGNISKVGTPEKDAHNNAMTFLCSNLYEILNRNQIPVRQNSEENSQDMIIKVFETIAHDLRLKKERVENLENQDSENVKLINKLKDANEELKHDNDKLSHKIDTQNNHYTKQFRAQQEHIDELQSSQIAERERSKIEIERIKNKNRTLEIKFSQMEDEVNDSRSEIEMYKMQIKELKSRIRQKEESFFK